MSGPTNNDWENDPVWNLLDDAKPPQAGPLFVRNVMREVRLAREKPTAWWQRLLTPKPLVAGALAAAAAVAIIASVDFGAPDTPGLTGTENPVSPPPVAVEQQVDELVNEELVLEASMDPGAFSDEVLVALLY